MSQLFLTRRLQKTLLHIREFDFWLRFHNEIELIRSIFHGHLPPSDIVQLYQYGLQSIKGDFPLDFPAVNYISARVYGVIN